VINEDYVKRLEEQNAELSAKLDVATEVTDKLANDPMGELLSTLIRESLRSQQQQGPPNIGSKAWILERCMLKLTFPRGIGLSTGIIRAAARYFDRIDVLTTMQSSHSLAHQHFTTSRLHGIRTQCFIVDPWSYKYRDDWASREWQTALDQIISCFSPEKPCLLILAA
jgi:hypothetical protein